MVRRSNRLQPDYHIDGFIGNCVNTKRATILDTGATQRLFCNMVAEPTHILVDILRSHSRGWPQETPDRAPTYLVISPSRMATIRSDASAVVKDRVCHEPHGKTSEYQQKWRISAAMMAVITCRLTMSSRQMTEWLCPSSPSSPPPSAPPASAVAVAARVGL